MKKLLKAQEDLNLEIVTDYHLSPLHLNVMSGKISLKNI